MMRTGRVGHSVAACAASAEHAVPNARMSTRRRYFILSTLIQPDAAVLEYFGPALGLVAKEGVEFRGRRGYRVDPGAFELLGNDGIGIGAHHLALDLLNDGRRRAGRGDEADPGRDVLKRRQ